MRSILIGVGLLVGTFILHESNAQQLEKSLLWEVKGNGIKPSYLFGTIHLLPQADFVLKEKVTGAFKESEQIVLELDMDAPDFQQEMLKYIYLPEGTTLQSMMSDEEYLALDSGMVTMVGTGLAAFNTMKPIVIQSALIPALMGDATASYEGTFVQMAAKGEKEVLGLETVAYQFGVFDKISYEEQLNDIKDMVLNKERNLALYRQMVDFYVEEDVDGLYGLMKQELTGENEMKLLLDDRNENWISKIGEMSAEKTTFFAVGAGHLGGEKGVIQLLKDAGYTVTAVK